MIGQLQQIIGGVAHGRDDGHNLVTDGPPANNPVRDVKYALRVGDRTAAVFLDHEHGSQDAPASNNGPRASAARRPVTRPLSVWATAITRTLDLWTV